MSRYLLPLLICVPLLLTSNASAIPTVGRYQSIDLPIPHLETGVANVWEDVSISVRFSNPGAPFPDTVTTPGSIHGFYHSKNLWMVRYAPDQPGMWHYTARLIDRGTTTVIRDSFLCVPSSEEGFIRLDEDYKGWWCSGSGRPFYGVGFGDCMDANRDSILEFGGLDGGYRPPGYHTGIEWILPYSQYLTAYGDAAGFNLYRYSDGNCAYSMVQRISASGNLYDTLHSRWTDTLFYALRKHGFRIYTTIFAGPVGSSADTASMSAVKRYAQYCIDRFGSLVDFWELTNESSPDSLWVSDVAGYIHSHDPYSHLVSVSWQQPNHPAVDIISPHWYGREPVTSSDQVTADQINAFASIKKPVIFGEQGEAGKWDSLSPIRVRGRLWSALFNEGTIIFWNSSFAKDCACNQYLGWPERRAVRVLQNFSRLLHSYSMKRSRSAQGNLTIWSTAGLTFQALYIRNDHDVNALNSGVSIPVSVPTAGEYMWYDVHTGDILERKPIPAGPSTLHIPNFQTDIALIAGKIEDSLISDRLFRLDVNPRTVEALAVPVNGSRSVTITLTNTGTDTITIENAFTSSPSSKLQLSGPEWKQAPVLLPGQKIEVPIGYRMIDTGGAAAVFSFKHSASPAWENVAFDVAAVASADVAYHAAAPNFLRPDPANGFVIVGSEVLQNTGRSTFEIYTLAGDKVSEGVLTSDRRIETRLLPNGSYSMLIHSGTAPPLVQNFVVLHRP